VPNDVPRVELVWKHNGWLVIRKSMRFLLKRLSKKVLKKDESLQSPSTIAFSDRAGILAKLRGRTLRGDNAVPTTRWVLGLAQQLAALPYMRKRR
jgi:hypothetical protein